ncbi:hypothetical protein COV24_01820 [candidate division WWE3 bacterium CG10_big_fil_rev_8_21_14_0_10_32_10]|uniref:Uncharacterized protein n=1 Tax=candidate division WWE3 bacterium CG10_big_fil_rev_8_21_14_0_10_32_10 TaxID=1975090 RepID=A0A2H0RAQ6_UNCKA|nr:MAG: hypothetical protein COV24_01820 [candidate division WWE3 bacterium CG10_big_fil_rev_8_21_14_0_10_32_10]
MELKYYPKSYKDESLYYLSACLLAAKNVEESFKIINSLLGEEEKLQIGRRIITAENLIKGKTIHETASIMKSGTRTVNEVAKKLRNNPEGFKICVKKYVEMQKEYKDKKYIKRGGSRMVKKWTEKTDFEYKNLKR